MVVLSNLARCRLCLWCFREHVSLSLGRMRDCCMWVLTMIGWTTALTVERSQVSLVKGCHIWPWPGPWSSRRCSGRVDGVLQKEVSQLITGVLLHILGDLGELSMVKSSVFSPVSCVFSGPCEEELTMKLLAVNGAISHMEKVVMCSHTHCYHDLFSCSRVRNPRDRVCTSNHIDSLVWYVRQNLSWTTRLLKYWKIPD